MTYARCIGEPISWLRIERFALGELPATESQSIRDHLARCPVCRACANEASLPRVLPALPALPARTSRKEDSSAPRHPSRSRPWPRRIAIATSSFAVAAAIVLFVLPDHRTRTTDPATHVAVRGGDVAIVVLREHEGEVVENPSVFEETDRFRIALTCPPGVDEHARVYVVQGDEVGLALDAGADFRCGNRILLEGAFRITGPGQARICAVFGELPADAEGAALARFLRSETDRTTCRSLSRLR